MIRELANQNERIEGNQQYSFINNNNNVWILPNSETIPYKNSSL